MLDDPCALLGEELFPPLVHPAHDRGMGCSLLRIARVEVEPAHRMLSGHQVVQETRRMHDLNETLRPNVSPTRASWLDGAAEFKYLGPKKLTVRPFAHG
jgi:hypothetical protein